MKSQNLTLKPISGFIGAEIQGVDLSQAISDELVQQIKAALFDYGVIFFREQNLRPEDQIALAERFGEIEINRFFTPVEGYAQIAEVRKEAHQKHAIGSQWHTDHSYDVAPALGSIFYAVELPPFGGDTAFASMVAAYDHLSDGLKETLDQLKAWHSAVTVFGKNHDNVPPAVLHPVVIRHPETGCKALFVNPVFTTRIDGWSEAESQPLLKYLYEFATQPAFCCRLQWQPGSLAFWDNRITQHLAINDYDGHRRLMHRITLKGTPLPA